MTNWKEQPSQNGRGGRYALSLRAILIYVSFCGFTLGACTSIWTYLRSAFNDVYSIEAAMFGNCLIAFATGLVSVVIGVTLAYLFGFSHRSVRVATASFFFGAFMFWPILITFIGLLGLLGIIQLD